MGPICCPQETIFFTTPKYRILDPTDFSELLPSENQYWGPFD